MTLGIYPTSYIATFGKCGKNCGKSVAMGLKKFWSILALHSTKNSDFLH
ncbi:hypothetical protein ABOONEI_1419 [Aciduliprofundum boonei T469]|nr:hypothetical protein ABOONEI_1419 [Aciduliprofundum boonei T469]